MPPATKVAGNIYEAGLHRLGGEPSFGKLRMSGAGLVLVARGLSRRAQPLGAKELSMRAPFTQLHVHLIWSTWDRLPLISPAIEAPLYATLATKCRKLKCAPLAIGGVSDHLHLLVRLDPAVAVSRLVQELKGSSSHLITHEIAPEEFFKWQGAYRAFSVGSDAVPSVRKYIDNQKQHHADGSLLTDWEPVAETESEEVAS